MSSGLGIQEVEDVPRKEIWVLVLREAPEDPADRVDLRDRVDRVDLKGRVDPEARRGLEDRVDLEVRIDMGNGMN